MQDRPDAVQNRCRTEQMHDRSDTGQGGCRIGQIQNRKDVVQYTDEWQDGYRTG